MGGDAGAPAGLGFIYGSNIQHPIAWSWINDAYAFGWYVKTAISAPLASPELEAWLTGNSGSPSWSFVGHEFCFTGNSTCLTQPSASGTAALTSQLPSAGTITLSSGLGSHTFTAAYGSTPICTATDQTNADAVKITTSTTSIGVTGNGSDIIAWQCTAANN